MSWTLWVTGAPAGGTSGLAGGVAAALARHGVRVALLDLDTYRAAVTPVPAHTDPERGVVYRSLVWVAGALARAGVPVLIDAAAHRREWRDLARATLHPFAEVQLRRPGATASDIEGLHEPSLAPELEIETGCEPPATTVDRVVTLALELDDPEQHHTAGPGAGWAIWITGLPGSGKTTIARSVTTALSAAGTAVVLLELADLRAFVGPGHAVPDEEALLHRVLVYAASRLTEAGVPVLVDATAPRRAWREQARRLIRRFAEVQLVCPPEVCARRERAVRWRLDAAAPPASGTAVGPDIVLEYETALTPDVVIHTEVEDPWTATETVLVLARRLHASVRQARESAWTSGTRD